MFSHAVFFSKDTKPKHRYDEKTNFPLWDMYVPKILMLSEHENQKPFRDTYCHTHSLVEFL